MRAECAAAVSTSTDADQPHPEEARQRRLEGRGVRAGRHHNSYAIALAGAGTALVQKYLHRVCLD